MQKIMQKTRQKANDGSSLSAWVRLGFGVLVVLAGGFPLTAAAQGFLPSLDSPASGGNTITPMSELMAQPAPDKPSAAIKPSVAIPAPTEPKPIADTKPTTEIKPQAEVRPTAASKQTAEAKPGVTAKPGVAEKASPSPEPQGKTPGAETSTRQSAEAQLSVRVEGQQAQHKGQKKFQPRPETSMALKPAAVAQVAVQPVPELSPLPGYSQTDVRSETAESPVETPAVRSPEPIQASPMAPEADLRLKPAGSVQSSPQRVSTEAGLEATPSPEKSKSKIKRNRRGKAPSLATPDSPLTDSPLTESSSMTQPQQALPRAVAAKAASVKTVSVKAAAGTTIQAKPLQPLAADLPVNEGTQTEPSPPQAGDKAAPEPAAPRKPIKISVDFSQAIQDAKNIFNPDASAIKPISYSPMPGIAVFAVVKHGNDRVFGDLPTLFAREYAQRLGVKVPATKVYNPIYTVDELRMQGLGHIYDQIMAYYIKTGAPEPTAMDYLLKQISTNRPNISRVIFVEADVDFTHPDASTNLMDRVKLVMTDDTPKQMKYFVNSRLQIFDAEKPGFPMVWGGSWRRSVKTDQFYNVTPSVYTDTDSQQAFARVSRQMSQEILFMTPKDVYMVPQFDTAVQGVLVDKALSTGKTQAFPNLPETQTPANGSLSHENKQAIERILERQNSIAP